MRILDKNKCSYILIWTGFVLCHWPTPMHHSTSQITDETERNMKVSTWSHEVSTIVDMHPKCSGSTEEKLIWEWGGKERLSGRKIQHQENWPKMRRQLVGAGNNADKAWSPAAALLAWSEAERGAWVGRDRKGQVMEAWNCQTRMKGLPGECIWGVSLRKPSCSGYQEAPALWASPGRSRLRHCFVSGPGVNYCNSNRQDLLKNLSNVSSTFCWRTFDLVQRRNGIKLFYDSHKLSSDKKIQDTLVSFLYARIYISFSWENHKLYHLTRHNGKVPLYALTAIYYLEHMFRNGDMPTFVNGACQIVICPAHLWNSFPI